MSSLVKISSHFKSSARVNESNFEPAIFLKHFIAHGTVLKTLDSLGAEINGTKQRTFTLTGPYGSGKSTLALFLDCLLSADISVRTAALKLIEEKDSSVKERFVSYFPYTSGWCVVKHLCGLESPIKAITLSILKALGSYSKSVYLSDEASCLTALKNAFDRLNKSHDGVLIILDELGKALDFQASKGEDLHFFQSFADLVQEYDNIVAIGFLHQSFSAYAKGRDTRTQNEWGKVQGRYKDFGFNPSIEESLYLIGESFSVDDSLEEQLCIQQKDTLKVVYNYFDVSNIEALENILPLDPIVGLLLGPISKRSFSQNERSLFSFIATHERFGFREYISHQNKSNNPYGFLYQSDRLWDYLYHNLGHIISVSADSKSWLEACDAVDRAETYGGELEVFITKLVSLLSIMGRGSKLYASKEFLLEYLVLIPRFSVEKETIEKSLAYLESKSIIIYRHNLNSYHVFRASDLDVNRLVLDWVERVKGGRDWVNACQSEKLILANSHYHRTGTMRWAETQVVSSIEQVRVPQGVVGASFVNFVVPATRELYGQLLAKFGDNQFIVLASPMNMEKLESEANELIALRSIAKEESEKLNRDPIAKTEIENREKSSNLRIANALDKIFHGANWYYLGCELEGKSLTSKVSHVADEIYGKCPSVHNELVNRMKLSGTSNAALNKLMQAILLNAEDDDLGLPENTFPPEKGVYLSCLKNKGWHTPDRDRKLAGNWFDIDDPNALSENERDAYKIWKSGVDLIKASSELVVVKDLYEFWMSPPYGLTLGLCKLYAMALLKSLESHLAFYDFDSTKDWVYIPELDEELVTKLWRYPSEAGVRYYELEEADISLVREIAKVSELQDEDSILEIARSLVKQMHRLPSWVKKTSGKNLFEVGGEEHLDKVTKRFRDKVLSAKDPYKLILKDVPTVFGEGADLTTCLKDALKALLEFDSVLSNQFKLTVTQLLDDEPGASLSARCEAVENAASRPEIENFAKRLHRWSDNPVQATLDELISLVVGVRKESWTDTRISEGYDKLRELCIQFKRYETFTRTSAKGHSKTRPVSLIFENKEGQAVELEQFIFDGKAEASYLSEARSVIESQLSNCSDAERVRVLVELLAKEMNPISREA